ncbi:MAG: hypothetical protein KDC56_00595 [Flavobacteriaceae bacterium]|nr:hypothetical protein [Flavobacteriaceae bacterium]
MKKSSISKIVENIPEKIKNRPLLLSLNLINKKPVNREIQAALHHNNTPRFEIKPVNG